MPAERPVVAAAPGGPSVDVADLAVRFGGVTAVDGVSLRVSSGEVLALVGGNGAGKSTTLRVMAGVVPATGGRVRIRGRAGEVVDVAADPYGARHLTGYCPDVAGLVPAATPWEHLGLSARLRGLDQWEARGRDLLARFELDAVAHRVTGGFSHGMSRRLSVVLAALHRPDVLLLDEPFDGVDPLGVDATLELVRELAAAGSAVLISTHLLELAVTVADRAVVLRRGRAVGERAAAELSGTDGAAMYRRLLSHDAGTAATAG